MSDTLANFISKIRVDLDERTASYYTDADLTNWINEGARELARRAEVGQAKSTSVTVTAGSTALLSMPTDVIQIHRVEFATTSSPSQVYPVQLRTYDEMDQVWGWTQSNQGNYPTSIVFWGEPPSLNAQLWPIPSVGGALNIFYYQVPTALTSTQSTSLVTCPSGWEDVIQLYVEYRALRRAKDQEWQGAKLIYEEKITNLIEKTVQWHDQSQTVITGMGAVPSWLYSWDTY